MWTLYRHLFPDGKSYIGITELSPNQRWGLYGKGYIEMPKMCNAILRFGWDNIQHVIEITNIPTKEEALSLEQEYIKKYDSVHNGYNSFLKQEKEIPNKKSRIIKDFPIYQINPITLEIVQTFDSILAAAESLNVKHYVNIRNATMGTQGVAHGYYWCFVQNYKENWYPQKYGRKRICVCDETQEIFPSVKEAAQWLKVSSHNLIRVLNGSHSTIHGYHFHYLNPNPILQDKRFKPIYCKETGMIYKDAIECVEKLNVSRVGVYHCCAGRCSKTYGIDKQGLKTPYHLHWAE